MANGSRALPPVRRIDVGSGEVAVVELGAADGTPAILLAGLSDGLAPVDDPATREVLAEVPIPMARYRGLAVSYADPLPPEVTTLMLADGAGLALRSLVDRPAVLVAHSLGAMVAQHLAADRPELVAALVLSATSAAADPPLRRLLDRWAALLSAGQVADFARDALLRSFTGPERERRLRRQQDRPLPDAPPERVARHLALSHACATHDARDRLHRIQAPTLVLAGEEDEVMPVDHAKQLAAAIPSARLEVLPAVGHAFPEQVPDRFEELVSGFLADAGFGG